MHLGHDILVNGVDIEKRLVSAVSAYSNKKYVTFGQEMGTILAEVALGTPDSLGAIPIPHIDVAEVA